MCFSDRSFFFKKSKNEDNKKLDLQPKRSRYEYNNRSRKQIKDFGVIIIVISAITAQKQKKDNDKDN